MFLLNQYGFWLALLFCRLFFAFGIVMGVLVGIILAPESLINVPDNPVLAWSWVGVAVLVVLLAFIPLLIRGYRDYLRELQYRKRLTNQKVGYWLRMIMFCTAGLIPFAVFQLIFNLIKSKHAFVMPPRSETFRALIWFALWFLPIPFWDEIADLDLLIVSSCLYVLALWGEISVAFCGKRWLDQESKLLVSSNG